MLQPIHMFSLDAELTPDHNDDGFTLCADMQIPPDWTRGHQH